MNTTMKTKIIFGLLLIGTTVFAQQNAQYNQYIFNELVINPAYAGTKEIVNANAIYSNQWTGFPGSPKTQSISIEGPVSTKVGLGLHVINDRLGAQLQQGVFGSYAYKLKMNDNVTLSMGIAAGTSLFVIDGTILSSESVNDPAIPNSREAALRFDSKTGLFLYSEKFYAGLSVSDLLADVIKSKDLLVTNQRRHYYLTSGYVFTLSPKVKFKPSFLLKEDFKAPTNIDLNSFFLFNERFWLGASLRTGTRIFKNPDLDKTLSMSNAVIFMTQLNITDKLRMGYAYTLSTSSLKSYPGHEIHLGYYFPDKSNVKMSTPRYF
jgi:type IX secretion system PorP/SprF family membrane protein